MHKNKKRYFSLYFFILFLFLFLIVGVGYAYLSTTLAVDGSSKVKGNTWSIYFDNLQINPDSVVLGSSNQAATIIDDNHITFDVDFTELGQFYEFTVDVKNGGTIDGMIGSITSMINQEEFTELPGYLDYQVTYSDDMPLLENQILKASAKETLKIRVEFKEGTDVSLLPHEYEDLHFDFILNYIQADGNGYDVVHPKSLYNVLRTEALSGSGLAQEYTGNHKDSYSTTGTQTIYHWYANSAAKAATIKTKWNVIFAGFCWQIVRSTDTGGVKLLYNGEPVNGECTASGADQQIGTSYYNDTHYSMLYSGYMYNPDHYIKGSYLTIAEDAIFGEDVSWNGTNYELVNTTTGVDDTHHYTCNSSSSTVCNPVRYYYFANVGSTSTSYTAMQLNGTILDGNRKIDRALTFMLSDSNINTTDSVIKSYIEDWYEQHLTSFTSYLEDAIFCNNRSIGTMGGLDPTAALAKNVFYGDVYKTDLSCPNVTDQFSMENPVAHINYPIGLPTLTELNLWNYNDLRNTGQVYWTGTPMSFSDLVNIRVVSNGGNIINSRNIKTLVGVRPVISLSSRTKYVSGEGTTDKPYIIYTN
ncbi:MAG: hypothetical protein IJG68_02610 [Bacilli bacterium]|nr:hypothetical protein [Bacilli bacterium]